MSQYFDINLRFYTKRIFVKRIIIVVIVSVFCFHSYAQDSTKTRKQTKQERKEERQQHINAMVKQEEEGALIYNKQTVFGIELRTDGYGFFYEKGRAKTRRMGRIYSIEISEIKDPKEEKTPSGFFTIGNPYVYGKINNFYQLKFGYGRQYVFGQKGNKNGVAVLGTYQAGLSLGLLRPYYIEVNDGSGNRYIKYSVEDSAAFLDPSVIQGSAGLTKGWNEMQIKPGLLVKGAMRFDWGHYNELVSGVEIGMSVEAYSQKIPVILFAKERQVFFQGHVALIFGRRKG
jgi:hypothetical protein